MRETPAVPKRRTRVTASRSSTSVSIASDSPAWTRTRPSGSTTALRPKPAGAAARARAGTIARSIVGLEDGLGLQVVIGHPGLDSAEAERILLRYATMATGADLESVPLELPT